MNPTEPFSSRHASHGISHHLAPESEIKLMAIDELLHQDDVELLKQQLAAAHQLLNYRQDVVHDLTEQINFKDVCLSQAKHQATELKRQCDSQQIELSEAQSICSDLRELLKRQQRRSPSPVSHKALNEGRHVFSVKTQSITQRESISFGYESVEAAGNPPSLTKAPPVEAWSANQNRNFHGEAILCQRLTTLVVSSAEGATLSARRAVDVSTHIVSHNPDSHRHPVELPRFTMS